MPGAIGAESYINDAPDDTTRWERLVEVAEMIFKETEDDAADSDDSTTTKKRRLQRRNAYTAQDWSATQQMDQ